MRARLFLIFVLVLAGVLTNVALAGNIAHGVKVVVIDPGHGGEFPGAHYGGTSEKDLVLKVALKLGKLIEQEMPGVKVVYTRTTDKALYAAKDKGLDSKVRLARDLQARADIANKANGDIFISIHANAAKSTAARGVETLIMGESTTEQARNEDALFENNRDDLIDMSDEKTAAIVRAYLQNLQFTYGEYSTAMARCIQNNYLKTGRHSRGVKPKLLKVLYATDMPSVLTEIGFMSNAQELAYMKSTKGQDEIARSLLEGLKEYSAYVLETRIDDEPEIAVKPEKKNGSVVVGKEPERVPETKDKAGAKGGTTQQQPAVPAKADTPKDTAANTPKPEPAAQPAKSTAQAGGQTPKPEVQARRYGVQILASANAVPTNSAHFKNFSGKTKQYMGEGRFPYKYCTGEFETREEAQKYLATVRMIFPDAFVVCFQGTQIVK